MSEILPLDAIRAVMASKLPGRLKHPLICWCTYIGKTGRGWPAVPTLAKRAGLGASTVRAALAELRALGVLVDGGLSDSGTRMDLLDFEALTAVKAPPKQKRANPRKPAPHQVLVPPPRSGPHQDLAGTPPSPGAPPHQDLALPPPSPGAEEDKKRPLEEDREEDRDASASRGLFGDLPKKPAQPPKWRQSYDVAAERWSRVAYTATPEGQPPIKRTNDAPKSPTVGFGKDLASICKLPGVTADDVVLVMDWLEQAPAADYLRDSPQKRGLDTIRRNWAKYLDMAREWKQVRVRTAAPSSRKILNRRPPQDKP